MAVVAATTKIVISWTIADKCHISFTIAIAVVMRLQRPKSHCVANAITVTNRNLKPIHPCFFPLKFSYTIVSLVEVV